VLHGSRVESQTHFELKIDEELSRLEKMVAQVNYAITIAFFQVIFNKKYKFHAGYKYLRGE